MKNQPKEQPSYYSITPANVRYNKNLRPNEKLLYGEITCLANTKGYCSAKNKYFADLYGASNTSVSRWISNLAKHNYISIELLRGDKTTKKITERRIKIHDLPYTQKSQYPIPKNGHTPIPKNGEDNNTSINNKKKSYKKKSDLPVKRFKKPTLVELQNYAKENNLSLDAQHFIDFYDSKNWMIGKNKMCRWKSAVRNWVRGNNKFNGANNGKNINSNAQSKFEESEARGREMLRGYNGNDPMF